MSVSHHPSPPLCDSRTATLSPSFSYRRASSRWAGPGDKGSFRKEKREAEEEQGPWGERAAWWVARGRPAHILSFPENPLVWSLLPCHLEHAGALRGP